MMETDNILPSDKILQIFESVIRHYPNEGIRQHQLKDIARNVFNALLVVNEKGVNCSIMDIGGGVCAFSPGCAALGMKVTLVDDFADHGYSNADKVLRSVHAHYQVKVVNKDVVADGIDFISAHSLDAITSFDSIEHWHCSPKKLFAQCLRSLKPGGLFVLGAPNAANIKKRAEAVLGLTSWSEMEDWYDRDFFRGHVREPTVHDLYHIAEDMNLNSVRILGRNFQGLNSPNKVVKAIARCSDRFLRLRPQLCSDIYLVGRTPS